MLSFSALSGGSSSGGTTAGASNSSSAAGSSSSSASGSGGGIVCKVAANSPYAPYAGKLCSSSTRTVQLPALGSIAPALFVVSLFVLSKALLFLVDTVLHLK